MRNHLSFRSGNPALNSNTFSGLGYSSSIHSSERMTIDGTVNKTAISISILMIAAYYTYISQNTGWIVIGGIGGFITAIVTYFKKEWSQYTVPIYAFLEGLALGGISSLYNNMYDGIVSQAIYLTFGIFCSLLFAYKTKIISPTENFKLGIFAATAGIGVVYFISFIMSFFGSGLGILSIQNSSLMSIGFSLFVVVIASLNLVLDFDFIEEGAEKGAPKYMEWYATFGLLVTLIWLYLEILRLLAKLANRR